ncbi:uncharacterized protein LOC115759753 [Drosophila novamexicana]|uniref:uncharacterized protein LOC115759753 n=1 Tax=Drosophila novamexicana TaxID=47314 RepID=UPI0011E59836|nr:uncharacterized protein LOC115759753 [Drosophila novamexicana]
MPCPPTAAAAAAAHPLQLSRSRRSRRAASVPVPAAAPRRWRSNSSRRANVCWTGSGCRRRRCTARSRRAAAPSSAQDTVVPITNAIAKRMAKLMRTVINWLIRIHRAPCATAKVEKLCAAR